MVSAVRQGGHTSTRVWPAPVGAARPPPSNPPSCPRMCPARTACLRFSRSAAEAPPKKGRANGSARATPAAPRVGTTPRPAGAGWGRRMLFCWLGEPGAWGIRPGGGGGMWAWRRVAALGVALGNGRTVAGQCTGAAGPSQAQARIFPPSAPLTPTAASFHFGHATRVHGRADSGLQAAERGGRRHAAGLLVPAASKNVGGHRKRGQKAGKVGARTGGWSWQGLVAPNGVSILLRACGAAGPHACRRGGGPGALPRPAARHLPAA